MQWWRWGGGSMEEVRIRPRAPNDCAQLMALIRVRSPPPK